jgi:acetoin utilization deacetylase AcuC-like enzyme
MCITGMARRIFYNDDSVYYFSLHQYPCIPTGQQTRGGLLPEKDLR